MIINLASIIETFRAFFTGVTDTGKAGSGGFLDTEANYMNLNSLQIS
jgi:hypothetical protein